MRATRDQPQVSHVTAEFGQTCKQDFNLLMLAGDTEPAPHNTSGQEKEGETFKAVTGQLAG